MVRCRVCGKLRKENEFYKSKGWKCKYCVKEYNREYYLRTREYQLKKKKERYDTDETFRERVKEYTKKASKDAYKDPVKKAKINKYQRSYYEKNKEVIKAKKREARRIKKESNNQ